MLPSAMTESRREALPGELLCPGRRGESILSSGFPGVEALEGVLGVEDITSDEVEDDGRGTALCGNCLS